MERKTINVEGRRINKLEEILRLLVKLNEECVVLENREEIGYPIQIILNADGSGEVWDRGVGRIFRFENWQTLESFLRASKGGQFSMINRQKENE